MACQKLAEMDLDDLEVESVVPTDDTDTSSKPKSKPKSHKQALFNLSEDDPEFYKFLLENDKDLLEFNEGDSVSDEVISDSCSEEGKLESVSDTHSESDSDESIESIVSMEAVDDQTISDEEDIQQDAKITVTKEQVKFLSKALTTKNSNSAFKQSADLFHTAVRQVAGEEVEASAKLRFEKVSTFNELVICCLESFPVFLQHQLVSSNDTIIVRGKKCKKNWSKIRETVKLYLSDILFTLEKLAEPSLLCMILYSVKPLVGLFLEFRGLRKKYIKTLIKLWSKDERQVQLQSYVCMKASILFANNSLFFYLLKRSYLSFVQSTKFSTELNREYIAFLTDSLVEIYSVDLSRAYQLAFVYIRQLAIHLRNALTSKTDETTQLVYNWQFIHSIEFWCKLLATEGALDTHLKQLIFPLVQVSLGAISLNPIVKFYPLRFRCIRALNLLSTHTNTYIPLSNYLMEALDYTRVSTYAHLPPKPPNFAYTLKVPKQFVKTKHFHDYCVDVVFELLLEHLSSYEHSIAFPEMSFPILRELKRFAKDNYNSKHRREIKSLVEKIEMQSKFIGDLRYNVEFAPKDMDRVREWENSSAIKRSYLNDYLVMWRKSTIKIHEGKDNEESVIVSENPKEEKTQKVLKRKRKREEALEEPNTNSEAEGGVDDSVTDLNIDNWDD